MIHRNTLLNDLAMEFLDTSVEAATEALQASVLAIEGKAINSLYISLDELSTESFFTQLKNRFLIGQAGSYGKELTIDVFKAPAILNAIPFDKVRTGRAFVPPGFKGRMLPYLEHVLGIVKNEFPRIEADLVKLRAHYSHLLNNEDARESVTAVVLPEKLFDIKDYRTLKSHFAENRIAEQVFGKVYPNMNSLIACIKATSELETLLVNIDYVKIANLSNSFEKTVEALRTSPEAFKIGSQTLKNLTNMTLSLAMLVELTAVIPSTVREVSLSLNKTYELITQ